MKIAVLFLLIFTSVIAQGQSLKEALFSGKLKTDSGTVIRKTDDLSKKIDSTRQVKPTVVQTAVIKKDSTRETSNKQAVKATNAGDDTVASTNDVVTIAVNETKENADAPKENTDTWKLFMDEFEKTLEADVLPLKKIKSDKYYISLFYAIEKDGTVTVTDVLVSPESKELQDQIRRRLTLDTPKLEPVTSSTGAARRVTKKYNFTLTKE